MLIVMDHYLPGRLAGGPVTTVANLVARLGKQLRFLIMTQGFDLDGQGYEGVENGDRRRIGNADVLYFDRAAYSPDQVEILLARHRVPCLYLNSFFSVMTIRCLLRQRQRRITRRLILAPRGEFSSGALSLKWWKKRAYLLTFRALGLARGIDLFQASSEREARDFRKVLGPVPLTVAADVPDVDLLEPDLTRRTRGIMFLARISPMKNLTFALKALLSLREPVSFHIYGPLEDAAYWQECQALIRQAPAHVQIDYRGVLAHEDVAATFAGYDALLLPTKGENFGHVILEALGAGCAAVISDQTPWQDLQERGVGWVLPLGDPRTFTVALEEILGSSDAEREARSRRCVEYARHFLEDSSILRQNLSLFVPTDAFQAEQGRERM
ncbi:glycosyltransferase [Deinococcus navajonensis]|uniref:Glycosyltransferase n=1 Tax=Deinococcus navajonensis TaxID=309884 RepID=A0ABV8XPZ0_9DEIO